MVSVICFHIHQITLKHHRLLYLKDDNLILMQSKYAMYLGRATKTRRALHHKNEKRGHNHHQKDPPGEAAPSFDLCVIHP